MHASLFALFIPFTVSAPNVNRDYISLRNIPQGPRKRPSLSFQLWFPGLQTQTDETWRNVSFVIMIFKPKTVIAMANMLGRARREATFIYFQGLFLLRTFFASYTGSAL